MCDARPRSLTARAMPIMAILMRSAADPCNGEFVAVRSPNALTLKLRSLSSVIYRRLPNSVSTYPFSRASATVRSSHARTPGKRAKYCLMNSFASSCVMPSWRDSANGPWPQIDLGVVGGEEQGAARRDERAPDRFAPRGAHGNVLKVRLRRGQPPGGSAGLVEARVDAARRGVDESGERVDVGRLELGQLAVFDQEPGHLVAHV